MNTRVLTCRLLLLLPAFFIGWPAIPTAATEPVFGTPFVESYTPDEYDNEGQCFDVTVSPDNLVYVANLGGVLEFDGRRWRTVKGSDGKLTFAVAADSLGRVWVGGESEMGVLLPAANGTLRYHTLTPDLPDSLAGPRSTWRVRVDGREVYFQTPSALLRYHPDDEQPLHGRWDIWPVKEGSSVSLVMPIDGEVLVDMRGGPLSRLEGGSIVPLGLSDDSAGLSLFHAATWDDSSWVLTAFYQGVYLYNRGSGHLRPLPGPLNDRLRGNMAYGTTPLGNGRFALTLGDGIMTYNRRGEIVEHVSTDAGLPVGVTRRRGVLDAHHGLWVPLDYGVARVELLSPIRQFGKGQGLEGVVTSLAMFNGSLYAGTSRDLYRLQPSDQPGRSGRFEPVPGVGRSAWRMMVRGESLFVGTAGGLVQVGRDGRARRVEGLSSNMFGMAISQDGRHLYAAAELKGIFLYQLDAQGARYAGQVLQDPRSIRKILTRGPNDYWLVIEDAGFSRLYAGHHVPGSDEPFQLIDVQDSLHAPRDVNDDCIEWRGHLWMGGEDGLFGFDEHAGRFRPDEELIGVDVGPLPSLQGFAVDGQDRLYFSAGRGKLVQLDPDAPAGEELQQPIARAGVRQVITMAADSTGTLLFFGADDGRVITYDAVADSIVPSPPRTVIRRLILDEDSVLAGPLLHGDDSAPLAIRWELRDLRLQWTTPPRHGVGSERYQYRLIGYDDEGWSEWSGETYRDFTGLQPAMYRFEVRAKAPGGQVGEAAGIEFRIQPPWYRTAWAWVLWVVLLLLVVGGMVYGRIRRERRQRDRLARLVRQRTEELQLARAQEQETDRKAQQMETAYKMAATLAHEFNNPLAIIKTACQLAELEESDHDARRLLLAKVPPQVQRMSMLLKSMLSIEDLREIDYAAGMKILDVHSLSPDDPGPDPTRP